MCWFLVLVLGQRINGGIRRAFLDGAAALPEPPRHKHRHQHETST